MLPWKRQLGNFGTLMEKSTIGFQVPCAPCKSIKSIVFKVCDSEAPGNTCGAARRTSARAVSSPPASSSSTAGTLRRTPPSAKIARRSPCRRRPSSSSSATTRPTSWTIASSATFSAAKSTLYILPMLRRRFFQRSFGNSKFQTFFSILILAVYNVT